MAGSTAIQRPLDCQADALCRRLGLPVGDMGVAQRHARPFVAEQAGDDRQRDASQNGVAREPVAQVVKTRVGEDSRLVAEGKWNGRLSPLMLAIP